MTTSGTLLTFGDGDSGERSANTKFQFQGLLLSASGTANTSSTFSQHLLIHWLEGLPEYFSSQSDKHLCTVTTKKNEKSRHHRLHLRTIKNSLNYKDLSNLLGDSGNLDTAGSVEHLLDVTVDQDYNKFVSIITGFGIRHI